MPPLEVSRDAQRFVMWLLFMLHGTAPLLGIGTLTVTPPVEPAGDRDG